MSKEEGGGEVEEELAMKPVRGGRVLPKQARAKKPSEAQKMAVVEYFRANQTEKHRKTANLSLPQQQR